MRQNLQALQPYCLADPVFFERPELLPDGAARFPAADRVPPAGWRRAERGFWISLWPADAVLPGQGWKVHVSATVPEAASVVERAWDFCIERRLAFKFLRSTTVAHMANAKYADRSSSGKLIAIYPPDEETLTRVLPELSAALAGTGGAYVLSDLRYGDSSVFVRYGAFVERTFTDDDGQPVLALQGPDGALVPDQRTAMFTLPPWVPVPEVLASSYQRWRSDDAGDDFPYEVLNALHYSNAGGVYRARDRRTGEEVVLREARPHAGLDRDGTDAVTRLAREHAVLQRLQGLACVPRLVEHRQAWEHHFLVEEHVEGTTLADCMVERQPLVGPDPGPEARREYTSWVLGVRQRLAEALALVHGRGIRFGDLHPGNVLIRPDGDVVLIDFELATDLDDARPPALGAPGFTAPPSLTGAAADRYLLDCVTLWLFMAVHLDPAREPRRLLAMVRGVQEEYPVPTGFGAALLRRLSPAEPPAEPDDAGRLLTEAPPDWAAVRNSLVAGILASATPERTDRLFPGDPPRWASDGLCLEHGAAGVLHALHTVGASVPDEHVDWLTRVARRPEQERTGLYTGLHGVATVLDELGRRDEALEVLQRALSLDQGRSAGLLDGRAGIGLTLLHFARVTGDPALRRAAVRAAEDLVDLLERPGDSRLRSPDHGGLLRGMTGPALLFLHLHESTGDPAWLDRAAAALRADLARGQQLRNDTFQLSEDGSRFLLNLEQGSTGLAIVLQQYLRHRPHPRLTEVVHGVRRGCGAVVVRQPGLWKGRAGFLATLAELGGGATDPEVRAQGRRLSWHARTHRGHLAFPGVQLLRLSMDLASGSAGVLLALGSAFGGTGPFLPYLDPRTSAPATEGRR